MKVVFSCLLAIALFASVGVCTDLDGRFETNMRKPAVAGTFYAKAPNRLTAAIDAFRESAVAPFPGKPVAIISPHAGYIYSGQIAADAFNQAAGHDYDLVVVLGTNHTTAGLNRISIYAGKGYETPLGIARIDKSVSIALLKADERFIFLESAHRKEHSIEVQIPFVQRFFPQTPIVAAIVGADDPGLCIRFGEALADVLKTRRALIVASTDLSHYPEYEDAITVDHETIAAILKMDIAAMARTFGDLENGRVKRLLTRACGSAPVFTAVAAARAMGANCARLVSYANSGDASVGDPSRVVGYGAMAFYPGGPCPPSTSQTGGKNTANADLGKDPPLNRTGQVALLAFARNTIDQYLRSKTVPLCRGFDSELYQYRLCMKAGLAQGCWTSGARFETFQAQVFGE